MKILIAGATGATGRLLVEQLLDKGHRVKAVARSATRIPEHLIHNPNLEVVEASLLDLDDAEMQQLVAGCDAIASCLGHNLTFKGVYGHPRRLVTDAAKRLCIAVKANNPDHKVKYVLMNTTGNRNRDLNEPISIGQRIATALMRVLLPPHVDNEKAADYLRVQIGQYDNTIEWAAVRPDGLIDEDNVSEYDIHPSPVRDPIFNAGKTSRINVAHFMAELITDEALWAKWKGQMPVVYNT